MPKGPRGEEAANRRHRAAVIIAKIDWRD